MTKENNLINETLKDFDGKIGRRAKPLTFLNKISKSKVYMSKKTGTIYHSPNIDAEKSFFELENPLSVFHYELNTHFNELGNEILSDAVTQKIN